MDAQAKLDRANELAEEQHERFLASEKNEQEFFKEKFESDMLRKIQTLRHYAHLELTDDL